MRDIALDYARRGWQVFPLTGKIPFPGTHGHKDATCDEGKINEQWRQYPNANIGIATGRKSGIFVVDIDIKMGKVGDESLRDLEKKHGSLPQTVESITASRGRHLFFRYPQNVEIFNSQSKIGQDIDVRGEGGYVVAPGSIIDGKSYEWEASCHPDDVSVADAPEWLIEFAEATRKEKFKLSEGNIPRGVQDDTLFRLACSLKAQGFTEELVRAALTQALKKCPQNPVNPFAERDIERWIKSAFGYTDDNNSKKSIKFFNDVWNADIFVKQQGQSIKNCDQLGSWHIWNGQVWQKDETHQIIKLARDTVQSFYSMASKFDDGSKEQKLFFQHIKLSGNENKIRAMVNLARSHAQVSIVSDEFDADPYLLNCQNGVFDLKNNQFVEHRPDLMLSKMCGTLYDKDAKCPRWEEFLNTVFIGNKELIDFIQKAVGYALTGDVSLQMFFILHGNGANGKSTFVDTINKMMGNYAANTPTTTLTVKRGDEIPNDVARLKGSRFVISSELERSKVLDEALVKRFTSDEPITARFLRKEFFEFKPTAKIFLSTNYKPTIKGTDDGIWRRIKLIPFEHKFTVDKKIEKYAEKFLFPELPGILIWAVEGYRKLKAEGMKEPDIVSFATNEYKSSEDLIAGFLDEFCVIQTYCKVLVLDLYDHFRERSEHFIRKKDFNDYLQKRGFTKEKGTAGPFKGRWTWYGIGLRDEGKKEQEVESRPF